MLTFRGFDVELFIDVVLARRSGPSLCCARDSTGARWLIVAVDEDPSHLAWLCVPVSERAMQAVATGRAGLPTEKLFTHMDARSANHNVRAIFQPAREAGRGRLRTKDSALGSAPTFASRAPNSQKRLSTLDALPRTFCGL